MPKMMDWADKFADGEFVTQRRMIREAITNPEHPYYEYIRRLFKEVDPNVTKTLAVNFFINSALVGWKKEEELRAKYNCNIPWAILLDPTSACNLHCTGCCFRSLKRHILYVSQFLPACIHLLRRSLSRHRHSEKQSYEKTNCVLCRFYPYRYGFLSILFFSYLNIPCIFIMSFFIIYFFVTFL